MEVLSSCVRTYEHPVTCPPNSEHYLFEKNIKNIFSLWVKTECKSEGERRRKEREKKCTVLITSIILIPSGTDQLPVTVLGKIPKGPLSIRMSKYFSETRHQGQSCKCGQSWQIYWYFWWHINRLPNIQNGNCKLIWWMSSLIHFFWDIVIEVPPYTLTHSHTHTLKKWHKSSMWRICG